MSSNTRFGCFALSESAAAALLRRSDLFLVGSQQRLHPLFQPLVFLVWPNKRDVSLLFSHSPPERGIFWHVMGCVATDATAMLMWTNRQSKPTVTAPPRATNLQLARPRRPFPPASNWYNPRGGLYRTSQANRQRYEPHVIPYPFKSGSEGRSPLRLASRAVPSSSLRLFGLLIDRRLVAK